MSRNSFEPGTEVVLDGEALVITGADGEKVRLRSLVRTETLEKSLVELKEAYLDRRLTFRGTGRRGARDVDCGRAPSEKLLSDYTSKQRDDALMKLDYLKAMCPHGSMLMPRREVRAALGRVWESLEGAQRAPRPPAVSTFYRWRRDWLNGHFSPARLVNRYELRGRKPDPVDPRIRPFIEHGIEHYFVSPIRPPLIDTLDVVNGMIDRENATRPPDDPLPRLTMRQLTRALASLDRYVVLERRFGLARARQATRIFTRRDEDLQPLQRVEVDHTPIDALVFTDDARQVLGRPYLTALIDVLTRMILAVYISFRPPNADTVLRALREAILPKDFILKEYGIQGDWPAWGVMTQLVVDNGREFHSEALDAAAKDLGISIVYCPPRQPFFKGTVERFLREANYSCVHRLPGTTFAKVYLREGYVSEEQAALTLTDLRRQVYRWVVDDYSLHLHRALGTSPLQRWRQLVTPSTQRLPDRIDILAAALSPSESRRLTSKGITINNLHYVSDELRDLRHHRGDQSLTVRPNHDDLGEIQVLHPETGQYFTAKCTDQGYSKGLTLEMHELFRRTGRREYAALPHAEARRAAKLRQFEEMRATAAAVEEKSRQLQQPPKPKRQKESGRLSGVDRAAKEQIAKRVLREIKEAEEPLIERHDASFDDVQTFPSGQGSLFKW